MVGGLKVAEERTDPGEVTPGEPQRRRTPVHWGRLVALLLLAAAAGFLIYQNLEDVPLRAFWWEFSIPLVVVVIATALLTLVVEVLVKTVIGWRRRHPRRPFRRRHIPNR